VALLHQLRDILLRRLVGCENFVGKWDEFIFNAFVNIEPVQRSENTFDMKQFRTAQYSLRIAYVHCKTVLNLLEGI